MMHLKKIIYILFIVLAQVQLSTAQETSTIELNSSLLMANAWKIDQFYIDSVLVKDNPSPVHHYYSNHTFVRSKIDTLVAGMSWQLLDANKIKVFSIERNYSEIIDIIVLAPGLFVARQSVVGSDGKSYLLEYRFKPYIKSLN